ncbi:MAG: hypothetical protein U9O18_04530 [Chloroflexota bacterium]|nr:hypothetical protein [Chloroflexota bacterium]
MTDRTDEQLLGTWMQEPVWLPESDIGRITALVHQTAQQRGPLPQLEPWGFVRMLSATRFIVAGIIVVLFGGFLVAGALPGGPEGNQHAAPAMALPSAPSEQAPPAVIEPTEEPTPVRASIDKPKKVHWEDGGITFDARDFTIDVNGRTFGPKTPIWISGHHNNHVRLPPRRGEIEAHWPAQGTHMRLGFELQSDDTHWWIERLRTYDGTDAPEYLYYGRLEDQTRTRIGEAFEGSLDVRATRGQRKGLIPGARLRIKDMRLEAFDPASIPSPEPRIEYPRMIVEYEQHSMLPGQSQRVTARWCLGDDCWPADEARWSTDTPKVVKLEPTRGSWTQVTALKPGAADVSLSAPRYGYGGGFGVHPRPGKGTDEERYGKERHARKVVVTPRDQVLKLGQYVVLTGWRCPTKGSGQLGPDGQAGTDDDKCRTEDLMRVRALPNSGLAHVGTFGPSAVMFADSFEVDDDDIQFAGVFAYFEQGKGYQLIEPNLYIRDAEWDGPFLGDLDADGDVDDADRALLASALDEHGPEVVLGEVGWGPTLDLNGDHRIDSIDLDILDALVGSHAGVLVPTPAQPHPTPRPDFPGPPPTPSASPSPEVSPET